MSLDTVAVPIPPHVVSSYLDKLDRRGETYEFLRVAPDAEVPIRSVPAIKLTLHREGSDDPLTVVLHQNGTWAAEHILVVGDTQ